MLLLAATLMTLGILALDLKQSLDGAVAVLYVAVVLVVAPLGSRYIVGVCVGTGVLSTMAFLGGHLSNPTEGAYSRFVVSLVAISITTLLSLRDRSTRMTLGEQARILELSHDTVIIRGNDDVILYWNEGAELLYGWTRREAVGTRSRELLSCECPDDEVDRGLRLVGQWSGEVMRTRRDGTRLVLATRWLLRRDPDGKAVGIIESSSDLTERRRSDAQRVASERRYRAIFDSAGFAMWESDWSETVHAVMRAASIADLRSWLASHPDDVSAALRAAVVRNANQAAADLFGVTSREDLSGANLCGRHLESSACAFAQILAALAEGATSIEAETRLQTFHGSVADVVLRVTLLPEGRDWSHVLVMAFDVTERNDARTRFEQASAELAHAGRVSMLGQLAASIAHEVNQPLTAIINYAKSANRWIARDEPRIDEVEKCLGSIASNGTRAAEVINRVRALSRKAEPQAEDIDLLELIDGALAITRREASAQGVNVIWNRPSLPIPCVRADRVQIQQVLVNLIINGIQAMASAEASAGSKELCIDVKLLPGGDVAVYVRDCGTGFQEGGSERIFQPFFTTKAEGMGMGLSICRSIVEAGGGSIWAQNNEGFGATVAFSLPARAVLTSA
jgi:PAS domain S-box-containing protein